MAPPHWQSTELCDLQSLMYLLSSPFQKRHVDPWTNSTEYDCFVFIKVEYKHTRKCLTPVFHVPHNFKRTIKSPVSYKGEQPLMSPRPAILLYRRNWTQERSSFCVRATGNGTVQKKMSLAVPKLICVSLHRLKSIILTKKCLKENR